MDQNKVLITKAKLDTLADTINGKCGKTGKMTIQQMQYAVDNMSIGSIPESITWHQLPEAVRKYLDEVTYDPDDYSIAHIADYAINANWSFKPIGMTIGDKTHYNEIPNVEHPFVSGDRYGSITPLDRVRFLNAPGCANLRDLGGWDCDGGTVKYGLLYRGGEPTAASRDVLVGELGIRHDLNLRGAGEADWDKSPLGDDIYFTKAPTYNWYDASVNDAWRINLRCVFNAVTHGEPVLFHCAAGADRTGTLACVLEGLLGMSQSDIDKDYELTCFITGTESDSTARRRNESEWQGLINKINTYAGDTFRDKCVTFAAQLGFTADEINAYRRAMIDGNPDDVMPDIEDCNIASSVSTGIEIDNTDTSVKQYQPYTANISGLGGVVIESVKVLMGGVDVTSKVFKGIEANLNRYVTYDLTNCSVSNPVKKVIDGQSYCTEIKADTGYTIESVKIKMGGIDMSKYYKNGVIAIPVVTGDLEITIVAAGQVLQESNVLSVSDSNLNKRLSGVNSIVSKNGCFMTDPIEVDLLNATPVRFNEALTAKIMQFYSSSDSALGECKVALLDATKNILANWYITSSNASLASQWLMSTADSCLTADLSTLLSKSGTQAGTVPTADDVAYVQFCLQISSDEITASDLDGLEILMYVEGGARYTNQVPISTDTDGSIFNGKGYIEDKRLNSSGSVVELEYTGQGQNPVVTGFIPLKLGDVFYFRNGYISDNGNLGGLRCMTYDADKNVLASELAISPYHINSGTASSRIEYDLEDVGLDTEGVTRLTTPNNWEYGNGTPAYIRFTLQRPSADAVPIITINEEID